MSEESADRETGAERLASDFDRQRFLTATLLTAIGGATLARKAMGAEQYHLATAKPARRTRGRR